MSEASFPTDSPGDKAPHLVWGTKRRVRKAAAMTGNQNAVASRFSEDLLKRFKRDPEMLAWIENNQSQLDSPNPDGTVPMSESQILDGDSHGPRKDYGDESRQSYPERN